MNDDMQSSKRLATIGSLLLLVPALNIVGIVLIMIGMKGLSEYYKDHHIYRNTVLGAIFGIIGLFAMTLSFIAFFFIRIPSDAIPVPSDAISAPAVSLFPIWLSLFLFFIFISLMAMFFKKAFKTVSKYSGVRMFRTVGNLLHISTILPVVFISCMLLFIMTLEVANLSMRYSGLSSALVLASILISFVSLILMYISFILMIIAFSSLKPKQPNQPTMTPKFFCPYCGTSLTPDTTFCPNCGK